MPIFNNNGKKQNVQDVHVEKYMELYPDATTIMEREGKKYRVKAKDYNTFLGDTLQTAQETPKAAEVPQQQVQQTEQKPKGGANGYTFTAEELGIEEPKGEPEELQGSFNIAKPTMRNIPDYSMPSEDHSVELIRDPFLREVKSIRKQIADKERDIKSRGVASEADKEELKQLKDAEANAIYQSEHANAVDGNPFGEFGEFVQAAWDVLRYKDDGTYNALGALVQGIENTAATWTAPIYKGLEAVGADEIAEAGLQGVENIQQRNVRVGDSTLDQILSGAGSMVADLPFFGMFGKLASFGSRAVGRKVVEGAIKREAAKQVAKGATEEAAKRYATYAVQEGLKNRLMTTLTTSAVQSGLTFGLFDVAKEAAHSTLTGDWDAEKLAKSFVGGTLMGAALGGTNATGSYLTRNLTGAKKVAGKVGEFAVENAVFTEGGRLISEWKGEEPSQNSWLEDYLVGGATLGVIKLPGVIKNIRGIKTNEEAKSVYSFTEKERELLTKNGEELTAVLEEMLPKGEKMTVEGEKVSLDGVNEGVLTEQYVTAMNNPEIPLVTKAKLMAVVEGKVMPAPRVTTVNIEGNAVKTYDPMGRLVETKEFKTAEEAKAEYKKATQAAEIEGISFLEDMYVRIKGYEADDVTVKEWLAKNPDVKAEDIANIIAKDNIGEPLTKAEQKILDSLREARREGLNDVAHLNEVLAGLEQMGISAKDVITGIEKPANERTEAENKAVNAYRNALMMEVEPYFEGHKAKPAAEDPGTAIVLRSRESDTRIDETANDGMVYTTTTPSGEKVIITGGKVVLDNEGYIDVNQSEGLVAMFPDGQKKPVRPGDLREKVEVSNAEEMKAVKREEIKQEVAAENGWKPIEVGAEHDVVIDGDVFRVKIEGRNENGDVIISNEGETGVVPESYLQHAIKEAEALQAENGKALQTENQIEAPVVEGQKGENAEKVVEEVGETAVPVVEAPKTALEQIPRNEKNVPLYEQVDSELAWDGVVEEAGGNEETAMIAVNSMIADKQDALKKAEKAKAKAGATITEKIAAENERVANIERAKADLAKWQEIAEVKAKRALAAEAESKRVADEAAAKQRAEEERLRAEREEAERAEREALNGVPDMVDDKPQDARARGYRRVNGHKVDRQEPVQGLMGKEIAVKFSDSSIPTGRVAVIEAEQLQPSHIQGQRNPLHFIDEAQPKERNDAASVLSARKIAENVRPEEITSSVTAYTGAPTVNTRGEAVQGNNRSAALRLMWENNPEQAAKYKQYLMDHAAEFGLNAEEIAAMKSPVLVNMLDVSDADAITLGQYVAQDTESGGTERIKPKNVMQKMGGDMRSFANKLLASNNEEASFAELVDANGVEVLKWMAQKGYITPTQYKSAFDSKGNLTAEVKNDLRDVMYQSIFKGGSTQLEEMFNALPAKAQKAILATAFRDYDSPSAERMNGEVQNSIRAYYALARDAAFANAKNYKEAKEAAMMWARQYQLDDVSGESFLPSENFSNFAIELAIVYKGWTQRNLQNHFNNIYDLVQGAKEASLFEESDNTPRTLKEAIKETFNIDYNGQSNSNSLAIDSKDGQARKRGGNGDIATGERIEGGERPADSTGGARGNGEVSSPEIPNSSTGEVVSPVEAIAEGGNAPGQSGVATTLIKGAKWENTGEPDKIKSSRKKGDSHDITWYIGKKKYGSTTAERDLLVILAEDYGGDLNAVWNAYEQGEVFLSANEAAILKKLIETNTSVAELQQGTLELDRENPAFERATKVTMDAVERLKENGVKVNKTTENEFRDKYEAETEIIHDDKTKVSEIAANVEKQIEELRSIKEEQTLISNTDNPTSSLTQETEQPSPQTSGGNVVAPYEAKINKKLRSSRDLARKMLSFLDKIKEGEVKAENFPADLVENLGVSKQVEGSEYVHFASQDGEKITLRLSDHHGNARNIIIKGVRTDKGVSIVISLPGVDLGKYKANKWAKVDEYVYESPSVEQLYNIGKSIFNLFNSGEYIDLADAKEHLRSPRVTELKANGVVYGWAMNGEIYLTPDGINPNTPMHEYAHLWGADVEKNNPKLWNEVVEAMKLSPVWNEVANDANYSNIHGNDSRMASEVLARLSGRENYRRTIEEAEKEIAAERDIVGKVQKKGILNRIKNALKNFWNWVQRNVFRNGKRKGESGQMNAEVMPWEEFANSVVGDFYKGKNPDAKESSLERMAAGEAKKESAGKSAVKNNANFVSTYKTKDGKDIEYTSERAEGYGIQGGGTRNSYDGTGNSILQRQTDTGVPGGNSGLNTEKGEFCVVERVFTENGAFNFTSGEKIESADDVAYIFSALEDAAKEHSFVVYVKDGKPTVIELGMGSFNATMVDIPTASLAYSRINPDHVYFVHNHPSGNLICSDQDVAMLRVFEDMSDVSVTGVIINLKTGKYGTFDTERHSVIGEKRVPENEERLTVHALDKQIFAPDYDPMAQPLVRSSQDVAQFLNSQRMGDRPKVSFLILSRANRIIGNIHTPFTDITTDTEAVARYINERIIQFGGENAILYGDFAISMDESRGFRLLQGAMERFGKTKLLDVVHVEGNFTKSAIDLGLLYEPETEYNMAKENGERYNSSEQDIPVESVQTQPMTFKERITNATLATSAKNKENLALRSDALRMFGQDVANVLKLMGKQREYDKSTVDQLVKLAKMYFKDAQLLGGLTPYQVGRVMTRLNNAVGKRDITDDANELVNILVDAHNKELEKMLEKQAKTKAKKVNASGVEVIGKLDKEGQLLLEEYNAGKELDLESIDDKIIDLQNEAAEGKAEEAAARIRGLELAREYREEILKKLDEIKGLEQELKSAEQDAKDGAMDRAAYKEFRRATERAILESKLEMVDAYHGLIHGLGGEISTAGRRAKLFQQQQIDHVKEIQHNANSDLLGHPADAQGETPDKWNSSVPRLFMSAMPTFQTMLKFFGEKAADGRGYLYERFIPQHTQASHNEYIGKTEAREKMRKKLTEIFGKKTSIEDFMDMSRKDGAVLEYQEGGEKKTIDLTRGQVLYLYMINKMADGQMKLSKMGITDADVQKMAKELPEEMVGFADWVQEEFLTELREKYNKVHERMFGAPMAAIESYFPIKINKRSRGEKIEPGMNVEDKPSTVTGSVIKRTKNAVAIDLSADAMQVLLGHIDDMENWAAWAEFRRDVKSLLNYRRFQNQVKGMESLRYGSGEKLWKNFVDVANIAAGSFKPSSTAADRAVRNIAKGVVSSKIAFRYFTAVKQILSTPAFWSEVDFGKMMNAYLHQKEAWDWAMKNLPGFSKRWEGRASGNEILLESDADWKVWQNRAVQWLSNEGMRANAFIDALTVATGAKAVFETKYEMFKKAGYSEERAREKALNRAAEAYNESQQSSESAYLSPLQAEATFVSSVLTAYRNSPFGYNRKVATAIANLKKKMKKGFKQESIEYMIKQLMRDGLNEEQAKEYAKSTYRRSVARDAADMALYGFFLNYIWVLGPSLIYILGGDDDEKKKELNVEALIDGAMGGLGNLPAGETLTGAIKAIAEGDVSNFKLPQAVAMQDMETIADLMQTDPVRAAGEVLNILVAMGVGVNPQTFTDMFVALGDTEDWSAPREIAMLVLRLINAPNSKLELLEADEAMENYGANIEEITREYAEYQKSKRAPLSGWLYSDKSEQKAIERYEKRFKKILDERFESIVENTDEYDMWYENSDPQMKAKLAKLRQKFLEGDKETTMEKLDSIDVTKKVLFGSGYDEINTVYYELSTAEDEDMAMMIDTKLKELQPMMDEYKKLRGDEREAYREENLEQIQFYNELNAHKNNVNNLKGAMKKKPEEAQEKMEKIRKIRTKAIDLINNYE